MALKDIYKTIKEIVESSNVTVRERIRSPFILTFIIVWIFRNHEFILCELLSGKTLEQKAAATHGYLSEYTYADFFTVLGFSIVALIGFYVIQFVSHGLTLALSIRAKGIAGKMLLSRSYIPHAEYEEAERKNNALSEQIRTLNNDLEETDNELRSTRTNLANMSGKYKQAEDEKISLERKVENLEADKKVAEENLKSLNDKLSLLPEGLLSNLYDDPKNFTDVFDLGELVDVIQKWWSKGTYKGKVFFGFDNHPKRGLQLSFSESFPNETLRLIDSQIQGVLKAKNVTSNISIDSGRIGIDVKWDDE